MRRPRRFGSGGFRRRGRKQPTQWLAGSAAYSVVGVPVVPGAAVPVGLEVCGASGAVASSDPPTIQRFKVERVQGDITIGQSSAGANGNVSMLGVGLIITKSTLAAGPVFPDPTNQTDAGWPWLWLRHYPVNEATVPFAALIQQHLPDGSWIDTKTKRIIREGERLYLVAKMPVYAGSPTGAYFISAFLRVLISKVA